MRTRGAGDSLHNVASAKLTPDTLGAVGPRLILPTLPPSFPDSMVAPGLGSLCLLTGPGPAFHLLHAVRYVRHLSPNTPSPTAHPTYLCHPH